MDTALRTELVSGWELRWRTLTDADNPFAQLIWQSARCKTMDRSLTTTRTLVLNNDPGAGGRLCDMKVR